MYTNVRNVQIMISLFKQFGIKHFVNSPGTRNTPLVHSIENDPFFTCYSIVDERSAAYFALGIAEALDVPVCITCTAATATCNWMPAIKEAAERNIQLVALTADRELYTMFHMADQSINQIDMYTGYTKYAVDIPDIKNSDDEWYVNRSINEALLEINHNGKGPIQINYRVPTWGEFNVEELPIARKISRYEHNDVEWDEVKKILENKKRIIVYVGSDYGADYNALVKRIENFFEKYNSVVFMDHFGNVYNDKFFNTATISESTNINEVIAPDLLITLGNVFYSPMKFSFNGRIQHFEHWHVSKDGIVNDGFKNLIKIFACEKIEFFDNICKTESCSNKEYYNQWKQKFSQIRYPDLSFTNFSIIRDVVNAIPDASIVHMSVLNSIRISNYFKFKPNVKCFANIGADGIDGALSTFLGQARKAPDKLAYLIVGDLSYLYDLNASLTIQDKNIRILVINNYAGAEFHKNFGLKMIPTLNLHIAAGHHTKIEQCKDLTKAMYMSANNQEELEKALKTFVSSDYEGPIILETFSDADTDAKTLKEYWEINRPRTFKNKIKKCIKKIIGDGAIKKIKKILKRG